MAMPGTMSGEVVEGAALLPDHLGVAMMMATESGD